MAVAVGMELGQYLAKKFKEKDKPKSCYLPRNPPPIDPCEESKRRFCEADCMNKTLSVSGDPFWLCYRKCMADLGCPLYMRF